MSNSRSRSSADQEQLQGARRRRHMEAVRRRKAVQPARLVRRLAPSRKKAQEK